MSTNAMAEEHSLASSTLTAQVLASLANVRQARGITARSEAFDRFKRALDVYDFHETSRTNSDDRAGNGSSTLYRSRNPGSLLTTVIVRELDVRPRSDPRWMDRFGDLEAAIRTRVTIA